MADETYPSETPDVPPGYYEQEKALAYANQVQGAGMSLGSLRTPPVRKILEQQITELKAQVKEREELLKELDKEPGIEKILDRMRKLHL